MKKTTVKLNEDAQRFMMEKKPYYIQELRATIYCKDDTEFEEKKQKLIEGRKRFTGGNKPREIKDYGLYFNK